jgi:PhzF family phenazine biosynthesis protein
MQLRIHQVDAFAEQAFAGNPAAVVVLEHELDDKTLQTVAAENNQPATAFLLREGDCWQLRWFTPTLELPLCGHATLASAWVVLNDLEIGSSAVSFRTRQSGVLQVERRGERLAMDFPAASVTAVARSEQLRRALGGGLADVLANAHNYLAVYAGAQSVLDFVPDFTLIGALDRSGLIVSAPGENGFDCVSRYFAPQKGVAEDAVTGSAHCALAPYWSERLRKVEIKAHQASARGGSLICRVNADRVTLEGQCVPYLSGWVEVSGK